VCHQTVSLAARHLEENGIATIVVGCAKDIVEYCGVPRFLFSDFPLGNAAGRPRTRSRRPSHWSSHCGCSNRRPRRAPPCSRHCAGPSWKLDYSNIERLSPEEIRRRRQEFDRQKEIARTVRGEPRAAQ
jgi:D-proline reductase (dithiol) PrdB